MPLRRPPQRPRPPAASKMRAKAATVEEDYDEEEDYEGDDEPNMKFSHALLVVLILHVIAVGGVFAFNSIKSKQTNEKSVAQTSEVATPATTATAAPVTKPAVTEKATAATTAPAVEKETAKTSVATGLEKSHTVVAGDTLSKIATQYGTSVESLEKANGLTTYSMIRVGQVLQIPSKAGSPAPVAAVKEKADITTVKSTATTATSSVITSVAKPAPATTATQPAAAKPASQAPAPAVEKAPAGEAGAGGEMTGEVYVVAKGDNPYSIAKRFGISYTELLKVNDIQDPTKIQIGQKLKVPAKTN